MFGSLLVHGAGSGAHLDVLLVFPVASPGHAKSVRQ